VQAHDPVEEGTGDEGGGVGVVERDELGVL